MVFIKTRLRKLTPVLTAAIEEFPIIRFYLYHVTSAGQSSNWTTSGIKQHILTVDLTLNNFYISVKILFKKRQLLIEESDKTACHYYMVIYGYICTLSTE